MKSGCKKGEKEKTVTETQKNTTVLIKRQRYFLFALGQFTRNYTQTTKRGLLTTNKG